jgi:hypothetical protein
VISKVRASRPICADEKFDIGMQAGEGPPLYSIGYVATCSREERSRKTPAAINTSADNAYSSRGASSPRLVLFRTQMKLAIAKPAGTAHSHPA